MYDLRNNSLIGNKLHRDRELFTRGFVRLADRARKYHRANWYAERLAERNQLTWNTTPCCSNVRISTTVPLDCNLPLINAALNTLREVE